MIEKAIVSYQASDIRLTTAGFETNNSYLSIVPFTIGDILIIKISRSVLELGSALFHVPPIAKA